MAGGLLAAIQQGAKLKHVDESEEKPRAASTDARGGLMAAIAGGGFKLKHVASTEIAGPGKAPSGGGDLASTLASALANRRVAQESSSEEDDSDWDDD